MRVMVMVKANRDTENGVLPDEKFLAEMGAYNKELMDAGIMLAGEGLHPSSKGKRVKFSGGKAVRRDRTDPSPRPRSCSPATGSGGQVDGRGGRVGQALPHHWLMRRMRKSRSARSSPRRTSASRWLPRAKR